MRNIKRTYLSGVLIAIFLLSNLFIFFGFPRDRVSADAVVEEGDYVTFGSFWGQSLKWQVIKIDANGYLLFAAAPIGSAKPFDAIGDGADGREDTNRVESGSNYWEKSNLREWLNSSQQTVTFSHQPPVASHVHSSPYSDHPGFLADGNFTSHERALIQPVTHKSIIAPIDNTVKSGGTEEHTYGTVSIPNAYQNYDDANYRDTTDQVFLLSVKELIDLVARDAVEDGKDFPYLPGGYWLRDAMTFSSHTVRVVSNTIINFSSAYLSEGVRPALYLKSDLVFTGAGTLDSPYTVDAAGTALSSLSSSASTLTADGTANATLTVTRLDAYGQPVVGHNVSLSQGGGSSTISPASAVTNASGQATFTVSSTKAETVTYTAVDTTDNVTVAQTASVTFNPGAADAAQSTLMASLASVVANGASGSTLTVTIKDANDNPITSHTVSLTQGGGSSVITAVNETTDADGQAVFTVSSTKAETVTYTAMDTTAGVTVTQTATVAYTPDAADAAQSTLTASQASVVADGTSSSTLTVTIKDANDNPITSHTVSLTQGGGSSVITAVNETTNADGQAVFTVTNTKAETVTYTAMDTTANVTVTQTATVAYTPDAADAAQSTLTASQASVVADGISSSTLRVTLIDVNNNPIAGHTISLTQGSSSSVITAVYGTTNADGQAVFTVTNTKAEVATYTAVDTTANVTVKQTAKVTFNPDTSDAGQSTLTASQASVVADGTSSSTLRVTLKDVNNNPIPGHTINLTQGGGSSVITAVYGMTNADGQAVFTVTNTKAEVVTYTAADTTDNVTIDQTVQVAFTRLPSSGGGSSPIVNQPVIDLNGVSLDPDMIDTARPSVTYEVTPKDGVAYAKIPASILANLEGENAAFIIEIKTPYGSYQVPVNLASLIPGLEDLLIINNLKAEDISFKILLTDMSVNEDIREALASGLPNGQTMGAIVDFSIEIINNSTGKSIGAAEQFAKVLVRIIPMPNNVTTMPEQWGAFRYNESAKKFEFVPAQSVRIDGVWYVMIHSYSNSVYVVTHNEVSFTDVRSHWSKSFVQLAAAKGLVNGVGDGKYAPGQSVSRAEFAAMLVNALGQYTSSIDNLAPYGDVQPGAWYFGAVAKAKQLGLLRYVKDNNFMPDRPLTREEMASMIAAAITLEKVSITKEFVSLDGYKDIRSMDSAYLEDARLMVKLNIMTGTGVNTFDPKGESTRAQAAVVFIRMLQTLGSIDR